jgi:Protein of unknown function (DUF4230)
MNEMFNFKIAFAAGVLLLGSTMVAVHFFNEEALKTQLAHDEIAIGKIKQVEILTLATRTIKTSASTFKQRTILGVEIPGLESFQTQELAFEVSVGYDPSNIEVDRDARIVVLPSPTILSTVPISTDSRVIEYSQGFLGLGESIAQDQWKVVSQAEQEIKAIACQQSDLFEEAEKSSESRISQMFIQLGLEYQVVQNKGGC